MGVSQVRGGLADHDKQLITKTLTYIQLLLHLLPSISSIEIEHQVQNA
jgi:hypothetical protein